MTATATNFVIPCGLCGQHNRVPSVLPPGKTVQCGACHAPLSVSDDDDDDDDDDDGGGYVFWRHRSIGTPGESDFGGFHYETSDGEIRLEVYND